MSSSSKMQCSRCCTVPHWFDGTAAAYCSLTANALLALSISFPGCLCQLSGIHMQIMLCTNQIVRCGGRHHDSSKALSCLSCWPGANCSRCTCLLPVTHCSTFACLRSEGCWHLRHVLAVATCQKGMMNTVMSQAVDIEAACEEDVPQFTSAGRIKAGSHSSSPVSWSHTHRSWHNKPVGRLPRSVFLGIGVRITSCCICS